MRTASALTLALTLASTPCRAAGAPASTRCDPAARGALGAVACDLRSALDEPSGSPIVVGVAPKPGWPVPSQPMQQGVSVALAVELALALGSGAVAWPIAEDTHRLARFRGPRPLIVLTPELDHDWLSVTLDRYPPAPGAPGLSAELDVRPSLHVVTRRPLDATVRRFLPPVRPRPPKLTRVAAAAADSVALACGDLGEAWPTVAMLGRTYLTLGTLSGERFTPGARRELHELAPVAPTPLREPLAAAWITPARQLDFGITDRATALELDAQRNLTALTGRLPWPGGGCAKLDGMLIDPRAVPCRKDATVVSRPAFEAPLDALGGALIAKPDGSTRLVRAGRVASDATLVVSDGRHELRLGQTGAALAVGDLDGDGTPELVTSIDTADPARDAVVAYRLAGATLQELWRIPVATGVRALAVCPERAERLAPILFTSNGALWMLE